MKPKVSHQTVQPSQVSELLFTHFANLMSEFYEMQSMFLSKRYKVHQSLETSSIIISLIKNTHLAILRQRENKWLFNTQTFPIIIIFSKVLSYLKEY